ncbi:MAG: AAA family ATPase [Micavibrio sp.]|nr:AAA family ATPase [Micavibrio sp.]
MPSILNKITLKNHSVLSDFEWSNIPQFCVITGVNGAGKTQLLEAINAQILSQSRPIAKEFEIVLDDAPEENEYGYVPWRQELGGFEQGYYANMQSDLNNFINRARNGSLSPQQDQNIWKIYQLLKQKLPIDPKNQPENYYRDNHEFLDAFRTAWAYAQDVTLNKYISRLFVNYIVRRERLILQAHDKKTGNSINEEVIIEKLKEAPWDLINQLFQRYGFKYRINNPTSSHNPYDVRFVLEADKNVQVNFERLSSGEQMIVTLILWSFNDELAQLKKLIILDEPDAHLHPEMALMFKEIISDVLVKKFGIQIIMTTHSPTTLCWMEEESIYLMNRNTGIEKATKQNALNKLTSGLLFVHEAFKIILVEGEDDTKFYQKVFDNLVFNKVLEQRVPLVFKAVETPKANGGGKTNVIEVCRQWANFSNKTEVAGLINGLVDKDNDQNESLPDNVQHISRYCFESYLADPLIIFALLVQEGEAETVKFANQVGYQHGEELRFKTAKIQDAQKIADYILQKLVSANVGLNQIDCDDRVEIEYINGIKIKIPKVFLEQSGKDVLLDFYKKTFASKSSNINQNKLIDMMVKTHLISIDFKNLYDGLMK